MMVVRIVNGKIKVERMKEKMKMMRMKKKNNLKILMMKIMKVKMMNKLEKKVTKRKQLPIKVLQRKKQIEDGMSGRNKIG